ncbi:hypothetical protein ACH4SK_16340 [Streptomyces inhibens]|uniref:hypothetical protein n=1 Tax=Streptomyces inhibens TaxID=2293571 RepID=UPI0037991032
MTNHGQNEAAASPPTALRSRRRLGSMMSGDRRWLAGLKRERPRATYRTDLGTVGFGMWLLTGLFVDGFAHRNLNLQQESFFTPWHAIFYSGFAATAGWILWHIWRNMQSGYVGLSAIPAGYGGAVAGLVIFAEGGAGDVTWHTLFGIEQDLDALFSPSHLLLFTGIFLILSAPLVAAWTRPDPPDGAAPSARAFLPVTLSLAWSSGLIAFCFGYWGAAGEEGVGKDITSWARSLDRLPAVRMPGSNEADTISQFVQETSLASLFATSAILLLPALLVSRRWRVPFGTFTLTWTLVATLTQVADGFGGAPRIGAFTLAGLAVDLLTRWFRPDRGGTASLAFVGCGGALAWTSAYFTIVQLTSGIGMHLEMWTGVITWSVILGGLAGAVIASVARLGGAPPQPPSARAETSAASC